MFQDRLENAGAYPVTGTDLTNSATGTSAVPDMCSTRDKVAEYRKLKKRIIGFASLLVSGLASAAGFMLIASQRWALLDERTVAGIILFVQWQTLGLTVSKLGAENVVFAVVSSEQTRYFDPYRFVFRKVVPIAALFSTLVWVIFSPSAGLVCIGSIVLDAVSLIIMADLNARGMYGVTSFSNLLNYPLFFLLLLCLLYFEVAHLDLVFGTFLLASLIRWLWLAINRYLPPNRTNVTCNANFQMGIQQILNYLLFRSDQLIISFLLLPSFAVTDVGAYLYIAKFPEIIAGVMVVAGTVFFPGAYVRYPFDWRDMFQSMKQYTPHVVIYLLVLAGGIAAFYMFWNGPYFPPHLLLPFLFHAALILFVNNVTYSMLRQQHISRLLRNLGISVSAGLLVFGITIGQGPDVFLLSWLVPVQLICFLVLTFGTSWGRRARIYV